MLHGFYLSNRFASIQWAMRMIFTATLTPSHYDCAADIEQRSNPEPWSRNSILECCSRYDSLAVFDDYRLLGYVLYQKAAQQADIIHLVNDRSQQGKGYARQLLQDFIQTLKDDACEAIFLEVKSYNQRAIQLYKGMGFVAVGRRKSYYDGKTDAIIMRLLLHDYCHHFTDRRNGGHGD